MQPPTVMNYIFNRGSSASRNPSPMKLKANEHTKMGRPKHSAIQPCWKIFSWAIFIMLPQVGIGSCTPKPRKLMTTSVAKAPARACVKATIIGANELGTTWLRMMRVLLCLTLARIPHTRAHESKAPCRASAAPSSSIQTASGSESGSTPTESCLRHARNQIPTLLSSHLAATWGRATAWGLAATPLSKSAAGLTRECWR